jgi:hypothetical protein
MGDSMNVGCTVVTGYSGHDNMIRCVAQSNMLPTLDQQDIVGNACSTADFITNTLLVAALLKPVFDTCCKSVSLF